MRLLLSGTVIALSSAILCNSQVLNVRCVRTLDGKELSPDSIHVVCEKLGIDVVTTSTSIIIGPTSVGDFSHDDAGNSDNVSNMYDLQGRLLGSKTSSVKKSSLHYDETHGLIIEVPIQTRYNNIASRKLGYVQAPEDVVLTVWRENYVPTTQTFAIPYASGEAVVMLELLPWWKRMLWFYVAVEDPYVYDYDQNKNINVKFTCLVGPESANCYGEWTRYDDWFTYLCQYSGSPNYEYSTATVLIDTINSLIDSINLSEMYQHREFSGSSSVILHNLPPWTVVSADSLYLTSADAATGEAFVRASKSSNGKSNSGEGSNKSGYKITVLLRLKD